MVQIKLLDVTVGYNSSTVLEGITLSVERGEFVALLGPNGSGKTTLLRVLSKVLPPRHGTVFLESTDLRRISTKALARKMAVVSQTAAVGFDFTVEEIVLMGRAPHQSRFGIDTAHDREIAARAMARTRTLHLARRSVASLSDGEFQRVMLAKALAQQPEILLLDEPTSHLDMNFQIEMLELIRTLNRQEGITVIAVLHDLNLASSYCERIILLKDRKIYAAGTPEEVLTEAIISEVYEAEVLVRPHPITGRPHIIPVPGPPPMPETAVGKVVHVVCGGGSGVSVLRALVRAGYRVTAGALNYGDSDHSAAQALGIPLAEEAPFCPISDEAHENHRKLALASDVVVLCDVPFGVGNLRNLEVVQEAQNAGKPVVLLQRRSIQERDFTGGCAAKIYSEIAANGAFVVASVQDLLKELRRRL